jgi:nitrite reductase (NADH) small subunit
MTAVQERTWTTVCRYADLLPERGVAALLADGQQVTLFRTHVEGLYALSNMDPFSLAPVLSRGMVGDRRGVPVVVSPIYKQAFELATGRCVDEDGVAVCTYPVELWDGFVRVGSP